MSREPPVSDVTRFRRKTAGYIHLGVDINRLSNNSRDESVKNDSRYHGDSDANNKRRGTRVGYTLRNSLCTPEQSAVERIISIDTFKWFLRFTASSAQYDSYEFINCMIFF